MQANDMVIGSCAPFVVMFMESCAIQEAPRQSKEPAASLISGIFRRLGDVTSSLVASLLSRVLGLGVPRHFYPKCKVRLVPTRLNLRALPRCRRGASRICRCGSFCFQPKHGQAQYQDYRFFKIYGQGAGRCSEFGGGSFRN